MVQNDIGNRHSPTIQVAPLTSRTSKPPLPTHVVLFSGEGGLKRDSVVLAEQTRVVDRTQIMSKIGTLPSNAMVFVDKALSVNFAI